MSERPEHRLAGDVLSSLSHAATLGEAVRVHGAEGTMLLLREPTHVERVLVTARDGFDKHTRPYLRTRALFGEGLLNGDGDRWRRRRRLVQPAFTARAVAEHLGLVIEAADGLVQEIVERSSSGSLLELHDALGRATATVLTRALLGRAQPELARRWSALVGEHLAVDVEASAAATAALQTRTRALGEQLDEALTEAGARLDHGEPVPMLRGLLGSLDEDRLSASELREEVATLLFAGAETTASALAWTLRLLAEHPSVAHATTEEIETVLGDRAPTVADLGRLTLTGCTIEEAMRLYPPAWSITRRALVDHRWDGVHVEAGEVVMLSPWVTHRLASQWARPDAFDPARFEPERVAARPRFAYFPFLGGPRRCVGAALAELEARAILAVLLPRVRLRSFPLAPAWPEPWVTLRPRGGLWLTVEARTGPRRLAAGSGGCL